MTKTLDKSLLGKAVTYTNNYTPDLLFAVPREMHREEIGITTPLPFHGADIWNAFEMSWLLPNGKPVVAIAEFIFPCASANFPESKSLKLYLNSLNGTVFTSFDEVSAIIKNDLVELTAMPAQVNIYPLNQAPNKRATEFPGICLDEIDVACNTYEVDAKFLKTHNGEVTETVYSNLLKSNCLVTGQPDWASVQISYSGKPIDHAGLLQYIVSYRNHTGFHEQCVERIFIDIMNYCQPSQLTVYGRYTRRGGLDINSYRSTDPACHFENIHLIRQ